MVRNVSLACKARRNWTTENPVIRVVADSILQSDAMAAAGDHVSPAMAEIRGRVCLPPDHWCLPRGAYVRRIIGASMNPVFRHEGNVCIRPAAPLRCGERFSNPTCNRSIVTAVMLMCRPLAGSNESLLQYPRDVIRMIINTKVAFYDLANAGASPRLLSHHMRWASGDPGADTPCCLARSSREDCCQKSVGTGAIASTALECHRAAVAAHPTRHAFSMCP